MLIFDGTVNFLFSQSLHSQGHIWAKMCRYVPPLTPKNDQKRTYMGQKHALQKISEPPYETDRKIIETYFLKFFKILHCFRDMVV